MNSEQADRMVKALESIAWSLVRITHPPILMHEVPSIDKILAARAMLDGAEVPDGS